MNISRQESEFTYAFYCRLLSAARRRFSIQPLRNASNLEGRRGCLYLRHDVDVSLGDALSMAEIEAKAGVASTYMVIPTSSLYSIESRKGQRQLRQFIQLGHEVALHFDRTSVDLPQDFNQSQIVTAIASQADKISQISGDSVLSVSFHRPVESFLRGPEFIGGLVNAYSESLMRDYRSDSRGAWRYGDPLRWLAETEAPTAQLLTHPIWWGAVNLPPKERLERFVRRANRNLNERERAELAEQLHETLPGVLEKESSR